MADDPFRDAVSELCWAGRRRGYHDSYLAIAIAHRVGDDEWVIMDGRGSIPGYLRHDLKWGNGRFQQARRWTTDEVLDVCPKVVARDIKRGWGILPADQETWCGWRRPPTEDVEP